MKNHSPQSLLAQLDRRAKRSLGQNFLKDPHFFDRLLDAGVIQEGIGVVEIGPGLGALTFPLVEHVEKWIPWYVGIEADQDLFDLLTDHLETSRAVQLKQANALEVNISDFVPVDEEAFQVLSNLPYNQATEILFGLLDHYPKLSSLGVMVQKEVGNRLMASPSTKAYGRLSVLPQTYYEISEVLHITGDQFHPPTKVNSVFLKFSARSKPLIDLTENDFRAFFEKFLRAIFTWRRKTLRKSLKQFFGFETEFWSKFWDEHDWDGQRRGETLTITEMEKMAHDVQNAIQKRS